MDDIDSCSKDSSPRSRTLVTTSLFLSVHENAVLQWCIMLRTLSCFFFHPARLRLSHDSFSSKGFSLRKIPPAPRLPFRVSRPPLRFPHNLFAQRCTRLSQRALDGIFEREGAEAPPLLLTSQVPVPNRGVTGSETGRTEKSLPGAPGSGNRILPGCCLSCFDGRDERDLSHSTLLREYISDLPNRDSGGNGGKDFSFQLLRAPELVEGDSVLRGQRDQVLSRHLVLLLSLG